MRITRSSGPHLVNEFRAGWTGLHQILSYGIAGGSIESELGLTPYIVQSQASLQDVSTTPNIRIAGFQRTGGVGSNIQQTQTYQFLDNVTWTSREAHCQSSARTIAT